MQDELDLFILDYASDFPQVAKRVDAIEDDPTERRAYVDRWGEEDYHQMFRRQLLQEYQQAALLSAHLVDIRTSETIDSVDYVWLTESDMEEQANKLIYDDRGNYRSEHAIVTVHLHKHFVA